jgi:hypothetical protein
MWEKPHRVAHLADYLELTIGPVEEERAGLVRRNELAEDGAAPMR